MNKLDHNGGVRGVSTLVPLLTFLGFYICWIDVVYNKFKNNVDCYIEDKSGFFIKSDKKMEISKYGYEFDYEGNNTGQPLTIIGV